MCETERNEKINVLLNEAIEKYKTSAFFDDASYYGKILEFVDDQLKLSINELSMCAEIIRSKLYK